MPSVTQKTIYKADHDPRVIITTSVKDFIAAARRPPNSPPVILDEANTKKRAPAYYLRLHEIFTAIEKATNNECHHMIFAEGISNKYGDVYVETLLSAYQDLTPLFAKMMRMHAQISIKNKKLTQEQLGSGVKMRGEVYAYLDTEPHPHAYDVLNIVFAKNPELAGTGWYDEKDVLYCTDAGQFFSIKEGFWHLTPPSNNKDRYVALVREC